jgi:biopolymer transport protein ExbD
MTNLIDIVMVLLIVFILVSNFVTTGLNIVVPKVRYVETTGKERIVIGIDTLGNFTVNADPVDEEQMPQKLQELNQQYPEEAVFIQADQQAAYGEVANVISMAREAGFSQVNLPMQHKPGQTQ